MRLGASGMLDGQDGAPVTIGSRTEPFLRPSSGRLFAIHPSTPASSGPRG